MKDLKLGVREMQLILCLGGLVIALLVYEFVFVPKMDSNSELRSANLKLESEVKELEAMKANEENYKTETKKYQESITKLLSKFPADVKPEDAIIYARDMQNAVEMPISTVSVTDGILVYTYGEGSEGSSKNIDSGSTAGQAASSSSSSSSSTTEEDANMAAAEETSSLSGTTTGTSSENTAAGSIMLYKIPVSMNYTIPYGNLKKCINYIFGTTRRCSIDDISLTYDTATGTLAGTMDLGMYYISGTDAYYTAPQLPGVPTGQTNLFGTIE